MENLKPCPACGHTEWSPWIVRGHPNSYLCQTCGTVLPWEKINERPEDRLQKEIETLKKEKEELKEQIKNLHMELAGEDW